MGGGDYAGCNVSNHYYGRAVDIHRVNGHPVTAGNMRAYDLATWLDTLTPDLRPDGIGLLVATAPLCVCERPGGGTRALAADSVGVDHRASDWIAVQAVRERRLPHGSAFPSVDPLLVCEPGPDTNRAVPSSWILSAPMSAVGARSRRGPRASPRRTRLTRAVAWAR